MTDGQDGFHGRMVLLLAALAGWVLAAGCLGWLTLVAVPRAEAVFRDVGLALPGLTLFAIDIARWMRDWWALAGAAALIPAATAVAVPRMATAGVLLALTVLLGLVDLLVWAAIRIPLHKLAESGVVGI